MKDRLKQRFEDQKINLETTPPDGHRKRFEQRLTDHENLNPRGIKLHITFKIIRRLAVAAILIIAVTFTWMIQNPKIESPANNGMNLAAISDKYRNVETFYKREVNNRLNLIESTNSEIEKSIYQEAISKLERLETSYTLLEKDLASNPDNLRVINAMIKNYQLRIKVLETLYKKLEINKTLKIDEDEMTMIFINHSISNKRMIKKYYGKAKRFHECENFGIALCFTNYKILNT